MANEVKFLQGQVSKLIALTSLDANTIYVSNDKSVLAAGGQKYYGKPSLDWDSDNKKLILYGTDVKTGDDAVKLAEVDGTSWVKDGMLEKAELVEEGSPAETYPKADGPYIHLVWNTDAGSTAMYISVKDLVDIYTVDADSEAFLTLNDHAFKLSGVQDAIDAAAKKATVTSATFNDVTGTVTSSADGTAIDIDADGDDIKVGDYTAVTYDSTFATKSGVATVATNDTIDQAINKVEGSVKVLVDEVIADEKAKATAIKALGTAAGTIAEDGTIAYTANTSDTYIKEATSLADADDKLDAAIKNVEDKLITSGTITGDNIATTSTVTIDGQVVKIVANVEIPDGISYEGKEAISIADKKGATNTKEVKLVIDPTEDDAVSLSQGENGLKASLKVNNNAEIATNGGIELTNSTDGLSAKLYWGTF